ncbi:aminocarboxymuconate-semialdehyde decarboxylase [Sinosporangium album]|uniref:Aminocarboxymuconate-semialdehyde decarboxylase n=1 Tax=Sinosporangium album TaxID=504805 RepID=A0A1G8GUJ0_9ACTN|nr:amidohydrolase family protein [Sinosporangium album]SDH98076.1 aminocarboxymuconate-semialdehyde decarboxylase [Sinosporangium album]
MRIDVHCHYYPDDYIALLESHGVDVAVTRGLGADGSDESMARRFRLMDEAKVDLQILSPASSQPYFDDAETAVAAARLVNDRHAEAVKAHPSRFRAFASLPLPHPEAALEELDRAMDGLGMVGVSITTSVLGRTLADPMLEPIYAELDRRGATLFIHPAGCGIDSHMITDQRLEWLVGAPIEDLMALTHILKSGVPLRYERMNIIVPHLGGGLPFLMQRFDNSAAAGNTNWPAKPSDLARRVWYDTVSWSQAAFRCTTDVIGADRLLFGTDFPYCSEAQYVSATNYYAGPELTDAQRKAIDGGTAARLLGLDAI